MSTGRMTQQLNATSVMPWDFRELMTQTVTVQPQSGNNAAGEPTFGDAITIRCRIQGTIKEIRAADGLTRMSSALVILDGVYGIEPQDKLTLPDGTTPVILSVNQNNDGAGSLYEEILT